MATGAAAAAAEVRGLYRRFLREARGFPDYNIRAYVVRRSKQGFREGMKPGADVNSLIAHAKQQLELVQRQRTIYSLYAPGLKNIMEVN